MTNPKLKTRYGTVSLSFTALALMTAAPAVYAQATIYVDQSGQTGAASASSAGTQITLDEFSTAGVLGTSYNLSGAGTNKLVDSGSAGSEGALNYAGNYLTFAGYVDPIGTAGVVAGTENRGVGIINLTTGAVDTSTSLTAASTYSGNNIRSAVTDGTVTAGTSTIYTAGTASSSTSGGVRYTTDGGTTSSSFESSTNVNTRVVEEYNGNVYFSTGSATGVGTTGIYELGAAGSTTATVPSAVATYGTGTSPYAFAFYSSGATTDLYVADSTLGVEKFVSTAGSAFTQSAYSLALSNLTGITVDPLTGLLYGVTGSTGTGATTVDSMLYQITDTGAAFTDSTLAIATTAGYNFRGVQVVDAGPAAISAPLATNASAAPEPSEWAAMAFTGLGMGGLLLRARRRMQKASATA